MSLGFGAALNMMKMMKAEEQHITQGPEVFMGVIAGVGQKAHMCRVSFQEGGKTL